MFSFFPTPYPDEILYSVLCRYHLRCGEPSARCTNLELWGKPYGKKLFLPDEIEKIAVKIPTNVNLSAERFIRENTICPLLKPFLVESSYRELQNAMKIGNPNIYNIISFSKVFTVQHRRLRYCAQCAQSDRHVYGEPYWHRVHQLPGIYVCPIHHIATIESSVELDWLRQGYYPLLPVTDILKPMPSYSPDIINKLLDFSFDSAWLLRRGNELGYFEHTGELYDSWFRAKGYRDKSGRTSTKKLAQDIVCFYGQEFLSLFNAYNSGACMWIKRIIKHGQSFRHPMYHLLLIRFLAGSPEQFFTGTQEKTKEYLPYGLPPYPCRNPVCVYHAQDVIEHIEIINVKGNYRASFVCPHCGFTYRRKKPLPKEEQYAGQIDVSDYGWIWHEKLINLLTSKTSINKIAKALWCDTRTVVKFGIELGFFPPEKQSKRPAYIEHPKPICDFNEQRAHYRQRWIDIIAANPKITRNELRRLDSKADQWLHLHDAEWLAKNSPSPKNKFPIWVDHDDEYFEKIEKAVMEMRHSSGIPRHITVAAIGRKAGITKPYVRLMSDHLPKTKAFVAANVETLEQWQKRKILWAVQNMRVRGELLTVYKVRHASNIEDKERKLDGFIMECILNSE